MAGGSVGFDTETYLIEPGLMCPPLVCGSVAWLETGPKINGQLLAKPDALELVAQALEDDSLIICGANISYDLMVVATQLARWGIDAMPYIFRALEQGRIYDLQIAEALNAIANGHLDKDPRTGMKLRDPATGKVGRYSLSICVDQVLSRSNAKVNDEYRLRYGELDGIPIDQWPEAARDYPVDDAVNTLECALAQAGHMPKVGTRHEFNDSNHGRACVRCGATRFSAPCHHRAPHRNLHEVSAQVWTGFALNAGAAWGFYVDQEAVTVIEDFCKKKRKRDITPFITGGILRETEKEDRNAVKKRVALAYGAWECCQTCDGTGKRPSPAAKPIMCPDCRGRCQPWKSGGKIKDPTVASCDRCGSTGKVPNPRPNMITCGLVDAHGEKIKTCDGTGLVLHDGVPRSKKGGVSFGRDTLHESGDEFLMSYGDFLKDAKFLKDYIPYLRRARAPIAGHALTCPIKLGLKGKKGRCTCQGPYRSIPLTLQPNTVLETGRVSYSGYIQLFPRAAGFIDPDDPEKKHYIPSLRECVVARHPTFDVLEVPDDYELGPGEEVVTDPVEIEKFHAFNAVTLAEIVGGTGEDGEEDSGDEDSDEEEAV